MRALIVLAALLALLVWDLTLNDADLFWSLNAYVDETVRSMGLD